MFYPSLSEDCFSSIVCYVPLHDLLTFASTSLSCMKSILPELKRRRNRISQDHAWEECCCPTSFNSKLLSLTEEGEERYGDIYFIPSALARLKCLFRSLNVDHPQRSCIYQLIRDIENYDDSNIPDENESFQHVLATTQNIVNAHKLHSAILRNAMYLKPADISGNENSGRVSLHRYIGDLHSIYFCMGHSVAGIIEGVSETKWMEKMSNILDKCEQKTDDNQVVSSTIDWYQIYLFFHSSYLRGCPLSPEVMIALGLANESTVHFIARGKSDMRCFEPHRPFRGLEKLHVMERIEFLKDNCSVFTIAYDFGPLGPAFRGRDRVRRDTFSQMSAGGEPLRTLLSACKESRKINPMNVSSPLLTFDCKN